ncbi:hypothetical protein N7462_009481 [Penicillium macrosclerotiorum]|uniref:uncharacterized protein n=1 Tax=Penicillium macrosclerotiorum TaxID=303699 RepID=UPI0025474572|nr:uncharacterized protein N7462_009481 [Penicillium macrosclerotiorum]KAJ5674042.1 hypothetical protein N7462_009481 [Penicillium macrosclerotiorum]
MSVSIDINDLVSNFDPLTKASISKLQGADVINVVYAVRPCDWTRKDMLYADLKNKIASLDKIKFGTACRFKSLKGKKESTPTVYVVGFHIQEKKPDGSIKTTTNEEAKKRIDFLKVWKGLQINILGPYILDPLKPVGQSEVFDIYNDKNGKDKETRRTWESELVGCLQPRKRLASCQTINVVYIVGTSNERKMSSMNVEMLKAIEQLTGDLQQKYTGWSGKVTLLGTFGVKASSGVSEQPQGEHEGSEGVKGRCLNGCKKEHSGNPALNAAIMKADMVIHGGQEACPTKTESEPSHYYDANYLMYYCATRLPSDPSRSRSRGVSSSHDPNQPRGRSRDATSSHDPNQPRGRSSSRPPQTGKPIRHYKIAKSKGIRVVDEALREALRRNKAEGEKDDWTAGKIIVELGIAHDHAHWHLELGPPGKDRYHWSTDGYKLLSLPLEWFMHLMPPRS